MTSILYNNFVRGKLDEDLSGRFDLPLFNNGFPVIQNFISNYKGILKYRTGFEYVSIPIENKYTRLIEFKFNTEQSYLLEFTEGRVRFYSYDSEGYFGYVTNDNGDVLEMQTDLTESQIKNMQVTQNADAMFLAEKSMKVKTIRRTSSNVFTFNDAVITGIEEEFGNPGCVTFYKGRLWLGGFEKKPTSVRASQFAGYEDFTVTKENIKDNDPISLTLTDISDPILWLYGGKKNLLAGNTEGVSILNGGSTDKSITATSPNADLGNKEGVSSAIPTEKNSQMIYVGVDKTNVYAFDYDLVSEKFVSSSLNLLSKSIDGIEELKYKRDNNDIVYCRTSKGQLLGLLYNKDENIVGWFPIKTKGFINSLCTVTRPDGKDDLFINVTRGGVSYIERLTDEVVFEDMYEIDELNQIDEKEHELGKIKKLKKCVYLDNARHFEERHTEELRTYKYDYNPTGTIVVETYNVVDVKGFDFTNEHIGRLFYYYDDKKELKIGRILKNALISYDGPTITVFEPLTAGIPLEKAMPEAPNTNEWWLGFKNLNIENVPDETHLTVFTDVGNKGVYKVTNGKIELPNDVMWATVGYSYLGLAKTFNIGSWYNAENYQTVNKRIVSFAVRFVNSGSFKIGTSLDNLQELQALTADGYFDTAPYLMNEDRFVYGYNDTHDKEKCVFMVQDNPLPCNVSMVECKITFNKLS